MRAVPHRFLFTCWPFVGHVLPQVSIAKALQDAGHQVAFYTGAGARDLLDPAGLEVFPFVRVDEERAAAHMRTLEEMPRPGLTGLRLVQRTLEEWLVESIPGQLADLEPLVEAWRPDVIVTDLSLWSTMVILWEKVPVPVALSSTFMGPTIPGPEAPAAGMGLKPPRTAPGRLAAQAITKATDLFARRLRRGVDMLRAAHGLGPLGGSVNDLTARLPLYLVPTVPGLDYNRGDLPASVHYVGPCIWNPPSAETAAWLDRVPAGHPWVHVTESTLRSGDAFILKSAALGLGGLPLEVIMTTGRHRRLDELGLDDLAPNIRVAPWLNHNELMPRCDVLVTAGGTGTVMAALQAGVPVVVVPTTWDKPDNARRIVNAGLGVQVPPRRCNPESLRAAVDEVLGDPGYRQRACAMAAELAAAPGASGAATLLAEVAGRMAAR